ncbi:MAG: hydrogenase expression/formation protein HypE [Bacteroidales bacterium]|nr:hydrogenase expression/formation protein HypE [Bacteroidales bacterium]
MHGINTVRCMDEFITMDHGAGGRRTQELIKTLFARSFDMEAPLTDSAIIGFDGGSVAFTTDSYVVDPLFFPGGNIGKLAVCGTVNDLAVSGAVPKYLSASFIIEEGFKLSLLEEIVVSMANEAKNAGVRIVTGDTKVVGRGKCDGIFINTSGTGLIQHDRIHTGKGSRVEPGDMLIVNGPLGNHSVAVLGSRKGLSFTTPVESDCTSLNHIIDSVFRSGARVNFMRDLTRGGLAGVLNELAEITGKAIMIDEGSVPVDDPVRGACEMLGFDPLYLANEGKLLIVTPSNDTDAIIEVLRSFPYGSKAAVIGEVVPGNKHMVVARTVTGGKRIIDVPSGLQLPRIC